MRYTLAEIAEKLNGKVHGNDNETVSSLSTLDKAEPGQLSFLSNPKYINQLKNTQATAVLIAKEALPICPTNAIVIDNPYFAFAIIGQLFDDKPKYDSGIDQSARIDPTAKVANSAYVGPNVFIGAHTIIGENVQLEVNSVISAKCEIGNGSIIKANATLYHNVRLGKNCIVHSGAVLGSDGFGNAKDANGNWMKIPQLGGVKCGNYVEIGANATIDRGAIADTILADGVKIDNLVQVAHNVEVGENTALAAQVGIAGSTKVGKNCLFGGQVGISGHINIADNVLIGAKTGTTRSLNKPGAYMSHMEAQPHIQWKRILNRLININKLHTRVLEIEKKIQK